MRGERNAKVYCVRAWLAVDRTTESMAWGRRSSTRCKYILVRSPPASLPPDGRRPSPPTHVQAMLPSDKYPGEPQGNPPDRRDGRQEHEAGRGFGGRLEARMPEASLQGSTRGVPPKPLPASCPALPPRICTPPVHSDFLYPINTTPLSPIQGSLLRQDPLNLEGPVVLKRGR